MFDRIRRALGFGASGGSLGITLVRIGVFLAVLAGLAAASGVLVGGSMSEAVSIATGAAILVGALAVGCLSMGGALVGVSLVRTTR